MAGQPARRTYSFSPALPMCLMGLRDFECRALTESSRLPRRIRGFFPRPQRRSGGLPREMRGRFRQNPRRRSGHPRVGRTPPLSRSPLRLRRQAPIPVARRRNPGCSLFLRSRRSKHRNLSNTFRSKGCSRLRKLRAEGRLRPAGHSMPMASAMISPGMPKQGALWRPGRSDDGSGFRLE